jgi:hypothetical protein
MVGSGRTHLVQAVATYKPELFDGESALFWVKWHAAFLAAFERLSIDWITRGDPSHLMTAHRQLSARPVAAADHLALSAGIARLKRPVGPARISRFRIRLPADIGIEIPK